MVYGLRWTRDSLSEKSRNCFLVMIRKAFQKLNPRKGWTEGRFLNMEAVATLLDVLPYLWTYPRKAGQNRLHLNPKFTSG